MALLWVRVVGTGRSDGSRDARAVGFSGLVKWLSEWNAGWSSCLDEVGLAMAWRWLVNFPTRKGLVNLPAMWGAVCSAARVRAWCEVILGGGNKGARCFGDLGW